MTTRKGPSTALRRLGGSAAWALAVLTVAGVAWCLIGSASQRLLKRNGEAVAIGYARYVTDATPGLRSFFETRRLDRDSREQLKRLRRLGEVFRFKLFDRDGHPLLVSDELDRDGPVAARPSVGTALGGHHGGNGHVRAIVLGGENFVETVSGKGQGDRPALYVEAYVPMRIGGQVVGVVEVYVDQTAEAARIHAAFVQVGAVVGGLSILFIAALGVQFRTRMAERRKAADRLRFLAEHDVLSGALNRATFHDALNRVAWRADEGGPPFAVLCIDLDRFKEINDTCGHGAGDAVLEQVVERLRPMLRRGDLVARLGGDEFAVLQHAVRSPEDVARLAGRVVETLAAPFEFSGQRIPCGASVGVARYGVDAVSVPDLLHKADVAMYRAKSAGRGRYSFYDAELDQRLAERRTLARELRTAVDDGAMSMHFQPLYAIDGTSLLGYEALMRWKHPRRGSVPPSEFIPLAEEIGEIERLGEWALDRSCAEAAKWPAPLSVSVNLSVAQFRGRHNLVDVVARALAGSGLPADRLILEITESMLMTDTEAAVRTLERLAALGVQIAMDDFGTGYSSLAYLWRFPFDKVKIDRAFTQGLDTDPRVSLIVRSIITLAHSMGIRVNAEGVETTPQLEHLRKLGCDELQGYLLGRPEPIEQLAHDAAAAERPGRPERPDLESILTEPTPL